MDDEREIAPDADRCVRIEGRDCVARNEPCPSPGWCPATTDAFDAINGGKTMAMAWALALVLQRDENGGPLEPPCPHEPRRRNACH